MDDLDAFALGMGLGLAAPKKASRRDVLLGRASQEGYEEEAGNLREIGAGIAPGVVWQCHCCAKDNTPDAVKCCVCGRGPGYRRFAAPRPLLLPGCVAALRPNQVEGYLDSVARKKSTDLAPAARDKFLAGPDGPINKRDERGFTSLHVAALAANAGAVDVLVARGALVEARTKPQGWRALHLAAYSGSPETVNALCTASAKVNTATAACLSTPLHLCTNGEAAQILLDHGADPRALDLQGRTPLHCAAAAGFVDVGDAIVGAGGVGMLEIADGDNWLPEATAEYYHHRDFVRFCRLLEAEAQSKLIEELPGRAWAGAAWDAGMRAYARREGQDLANGGARGLIVEERLRIRGMRTTSMMETHQAEAYRQWGEVERQRDKDLLSLKGSCDGSFVTEGSQNIVATVGTEGNMPLSGQAAVFDAYLSNLKDDESDPIAMRRLNVYSRNFTPLHKSITKELEAHHLVPVSDPRQGRPPLSLRRTPRQCHTIIFGGER